MTLVFNGSVDLLATNVNLSSITVRSTTILVVDAIAANPVAGTSFDVSGTVQSDNGSGLELRDGSLLPANILFAINGQPVGFTVSGGTVQAGGIWNATISLGAAFPAGNHTIEASFIPAVTITSVLRRTKRSTAVVSQHWCSSNQSSMALVRLH